jgi:hypothetical protein
MSRAKKSRLPTGNDHEVGYRKPPKHAQFRPGQSGNPMGRPRGTRNLKIDVRTMLNALVGVTQNGKPRKISTQEAMLLRLRAKALSGDGRALDQMLRLAQAYGNEEATESSGTSASDAEILQIYQERLLTGAAERIDLAKESEASPESAPLALSNPAKSTEASTRTRYRLKTLPSGHGDVSTSSAGTRDKE